MVIRAVVRGRLEMKIFSRIISDLNLTELPLSKGNFTWTKMWSNLVHSLIDRFLILKDWDNTFDNSKVSRAIQVTSDHFLIIIEVGNFIWGPSPFKFYNLWINDKDYVELIEAQLDDDNFFGWAGYAPSLKLRKLKEALKQWSTLQKKGKRHKKSIF